MNAPTLIFSRFRGFEKTGDYSYDIRLEENRDHVFFFPDNTSGVGYSGAACIRDYINAFGIPTIIHRIQDNHVFATPFSSIIEAMPYVEKKLDDALLRSLIKKGTIFHLPVGDDTMEVDSIQIPVMGCGTYDVPFEVRQYITLRIYLTLKYNSLTGNVICAEQQ